MAIVIETALHKSNRIVLWYVEYPNYLAVSLLYENQNFPRCSLQVAYNTANDT